MPRRPPPVLAARPGTGRVGPHPRVQQLHRGPPAALDHAHGEHRLHGEVEEGDRVDVAAKGALVNPARAQPLGREAATASMRATAGQQLRSRARVQPVSGELTAAARARACPWPSTRSQSSAHGVPPAPVDLLCIQDTVLAGGQRHVLSCTRTTGVSHTQPRGARVCAAATSSSKVLTKACRVAGCRQAHPAVCCPPVSAGSRASPPSGPLCAPSAGCARPAPRLQGRQALTPARVAAGRVAGTVLRGRAT